MRYAGRVFFLVFILLCVAAPTWSATPQPPGPHRNQAQGRENVLVGRISVAEGELLRYVPEQKDWVVTVKDTPFGLQDALYAGENAKAEFLMPNSTWIRIGADTQIQMSALKADVTEVDVASGMARFIDRSSSAMVKATTPFGYVVGEPGSAFDLYVGDESVEVIAIQGKVEFIHDPDGARYDVMPGSMSILADARQATTGDGKVDAAWDEWNSTRDTMLAQALETKGESVNYLPEGIREDSKTLDENGRWEQVYYQGQNRRVWRPTTVEADWTPYTVGRWTDYYNDYTWIPEEPFGYVTGHYGYWFWANNYWYWGPPVVSVGFGYPYWGIGFSWYPGRVGWLAGGINIGWFPLLPWEPFYSNRWWGPSGFVVNNVNVINININRFAFANRATVVNVNNFTTVNNFSTVRQTVAANTLTSQFRGAPVASAALGTAANNPNRFRFTNANPTTKPSQNVTSRVAQNQTRFSQTSGRVSSGSIRQQVSASTLSRPGTGQVAAPRLASAAGSTGGQARALVQNPRAPSTSSVNRAMTAGSRGGGGTTAPGAAASAQGGGQAIRGRTAGGTGATAGTAQSGRRGIQASTPGTTKHGPSVTGQIRRASPAPSLQGRQRAAQAPSSKGSARGPSVTGQTRRTSPTPSSMGSTRGPSVTGQSRRASPAPSLQGHQAQTPRSRGPVGGVRQSAPQSRPQTSQGRGMANTGAPHGGSPGRSMAPAPQAHPGGGGGGPHTAAPQVGGGGPQAFAPAGGGHRER